MSKKQENKESEIMLNKEAQERFRETVMSRPSIVSQDVMDRIINSYQGIKDDEIRTKLENIARSMFEVAQPEEAKDRDS